MSKPSPSTAEKILSELTSINQNLTNHGEISMVQNDEIHKRLRNIEMKQVDLPERVFSHIKEKGASEVEETRFIHTVALHNMYERLSEIQHKIVESIDQEISIKVGEQPGLMLLFSDVFGKDELTVFERTVLMKRIVVIFKRKGYVCEADFITEQFFLAWNMDYYYEWCELKYKIRPPL